MSNQMLIQHWNLYKCIFFECWRTMTWRSCWTDVMLHKSRRNIQRILTAHRCLWQLGTVNVWAKISNWAETRKKQTNTQTKGSNLHIYNCIDEKLDWNVRLRNGLWLQGEKILKRQKKEIKFLFVSSGVVCTLSITRLSLLFQFHIFTVHLIIPLPQKTNFGW